MPVCSVRVSYGHCPHLSTHIVFTPRSLMDQMHASLQRQGSDDLSSAHMPILPAAAAVAAAVAAVSAANASQAGPELPPHSPSLHGKAVAGAAAADPQHSSLLATLPPAAVVDAATAAISACPVAGGGAAATTAAAAGGCTVALVGMNGDPHTESERVHVLHKYLGPLPVSLCLELGGTKDEPLLVAQVCGSGGEGG